MRPLFGKLIWQKRRQSESSPANHGGVGRFRFLLNRGFVQVDLDSVGQAGELSGRSDSLSYPRGTRASPARLHFGCEWSGARTEHAAH